MGRRTLDDIRRDLRRPTEQVIIIDGEQWWSRPMTITPWRTSNPFAKFYDTDGGRNDRIGTCWGRPVYRRTQEEV
jgi:hypothetical protein